MKLLTTVAVSALMLAGCAPFEHGHYASDVVYDGVGHGAVAPVVHAPRIYDDHRYSGIQGGAYSLPQSVPATYSSPVSYAEPIIQAPVAPVIQASYAAPAPVIHSQPIVQASYAAPVIHHDEPQHVVHALPAIHQEPIAHSAHSYVEPPRYIEPASSYTVDAYAQPIHEPRYVEPQRFVNVDPHPAPIVTSIPISKPLHYAEAAPIVEPAPIYESAPPVVAATSLSVAEERVQAPVAYAPPQVVNAPPVYMRGAPQYANQPYPAPPYPQFGAPQQPPAYAPAYAPAPAYGPPPAPMPPAYGGYGYPQPAPAYGGGFYGAPVAANTRGGYAPQGYGYGGGCVTTCANGTVF